MKRLLSLLLLACLLAGCSSPSPQPEQKQYNAHVHAETGEEVKQGQDEPTVDDAEQRPTKIYEVLQFEVLARCNEVVVLLKQVEVVGTEVQVQVGRLLAPWVECAVHAG